MTADRPPHSWIPPSFLEAPWSRSHPAWVAGLPTLLDRYLTDWRLTTDLSPGRTAWHGMVGVAVPVRTADGRPAVLKVSIPDEENEYEDLALATWNGRGAVRLLRTDRPRRALLLERLDADRSLENEPIGPALDRLAAVLARLSVPAPPGLPTIAETTARWLDSMPRRWERLAIDAPRRLLDLAVDAARTLGPNAGRQLVHTDLHFMNVLHGTAGRGWVAIDPKPLAGDPEFAVAPVLWNRLGDYEDDRNAGLRRRFDRYTEAGGLDRDRARLWSIAREVENMTWYAEAGMPDDLARSRWVAATLAGVG